MIEGWLARLGEASDPLGTIWLLLNAPRLLFDECDVVDLPLVERAGPHGDESTWRVHLLLGRLRGRLFEVLAPLATAHLHGFTHRHELQFLALAAIFELLGVLGHVVSLPVSIVLLIPARSSLVEYGLGQVEDQIFILVILQPLLDFGNLG